MYQAFQTRAPLHPIPKHDSHGSNTQARHNSGDQISEPLRSLPGQPLCCTCGWDLRIHTTRTNFGTPPPKEEKPKVNVASISGYYFGEESHSHCHILSSPTSVHQYRTQSNEEKATTAKTPKTTKTTKIGG
jgi:hypothetical protein